MTDTEALAGYLSRYLARGAETARDPMDWAGQRLYALIANKLRDDPALQELVGEANAGEGAISPATLRRTALALAAAAEHDPNFARALAAHLQTCEAAEAALGPMRPEDDVTALGEPGFLAGYVRYLSPGDAAAAGLRARESLADYLNDPEHPGLGFDLVHSMVTDCSYPQNLGIEYPFTQTARNHLARFLGVTGHPTAASAAFEALLASALPAIGPEHPAMLSARDNQAALQNGLVNPVTVAAALQDPLADFLRVLAFGSLLRLLTGVVEGRDPPAAAVLNQHEGLHRFVVRACCALAGERHRTRDDHDRHIRADEP